MARSSRAGTWWWQWRGAVLLPLSSSSSLSSSSYSLPADSGTYRYSYRIRNCDLLSSPPGANVTLEVAPTPAPPGDERRSHGNLAVAVVRDCAAVLVFCLGLFFVVDARSLLIQRDKSPGGEQVQRL
ncbi:hypothetical protein CIB84_017552 [Bambusicola thoracicus]|uniref:Uncharacterized protein n=1 Tax=Bambusicola thoracicus TaxID=9083 RepID=A0A2P4S3K5_BAMTH|nr:hypothetical protein CIB84_017552 [Bambusicola thoracicus]